MTMESAGHIVVSVTCTTDPYEANDCVGGLLTLVLPSYGRIVGVTLSDGAKQDKATELVLFHTEPAAQPDADAFAPIAADVQKILHVVKIPAANYSDYVNRSVATVRGLTIPFKAVVGNDNIGRIWGALVTRSTPTYAAASLQLQLHIEQ